MILPSRVEVSIFQSTLSVRRATPQITVHDGEQLFQSTLSVRRATLAYNRIGKIAKFQSTLSVRRATRFHRSHACRNANFNPRSP